MQHRQPRRHRRSGGARRDQPPVSQRPRLWPWSRGTKQFVTTLRTSWPDVRIAVEHQIAEGDWVMTRWTARGTYQGGDPTLPATAIGKPATITGISINRFVVFT